MMHRTATVMLCTAVVLISWFCHDVLVDAQIGVGPQATENGDVNGDGDRDIADVVSLLTWLFDGGPPPVALACPEDDAEFGCRVAGTYFVNFDLQGRPFKGLLTLMSDGSVVMSSQTQYGHIVRTTFQSISHGRWTRTGDLQVTVETFWLAYGEDGVPPGENGSDVARFRWRWNVEADFSRLSGATVSGAGWSPGLDPINDNPDGNLPMINMTARRL